MTIDHDAGALNSSPPLEGRIAARFGVLPNFFRLAAKDPTIAANLWGFAEFAYLNNPLPSLFKERLFVYLSRFCEVRYCIARHLGFLVGLGRPAGDPACLPQTVEEVLPLLHCALPHGVAMTPLIADCTNLGRPLSSYPPPDTPGERALFACATHVFLQTPDATRAHEALRRTLDPKHLEHLNVLLAFVRTAHYWTKLHPEIGLEDDIVHLLNAHEVLAACVLKDPEVQADGLSRRIAMELESLTSAYDALHIDHEYVKQSLQEREVNLRELVSAMPAAVYACDANGFITYYNRYAVELWGRKPDLDGQPWSFLDSRRLYGADGIRLHREQTPVRQVLRTGVPVVNQELVLERPDLSRIHVLVNVAPLCDASGHVWGVMNIFQDITEIKKRQQEREQLLQELERSNRELSQFSYAVSHDLQAPLHTVRALTGLLVKRGGEPLEDAERLAAMIDQAANGMDRLIESLLRYAQAGQGELNRRMVSVEALIESVRLSLGDSIAKASARVICGPLPEVEADPVQLEQVFQNLIANAIKYRKRGESPVIAIEGEPFEQGWRFTVTDNGEGIPREHHREVFEPLKRLHGSETPGSGLGLALCWTIVGRHGGKIWVESEGPGRGASFRFTLSRPAEQSQVVDNTHIEHTASKAGFA
jgi:PAS domain S-box-containing protein